MTQQTVTSAYRRQHAEIAAIAGSLLDLLRRPDAHARVLDARALLSALDAAVDSHLALEDKVLYPRLMSHADDDLRATAAECRDEVVGMQRVFQGYRDAWTDIPTMADRFGAFRAETRAVLSRLDGRMRREREEVFPVLDRLGW